MTKEKTETKQRRSGLVLSRRVGERVLIGDDVFVEVLAAQGGNARLRFEAPIETRVWREEVIRRIKEEEENKK